jgi:hypothetical protein
MSAVVRSRLRIAGKSPQGTFSSAINSTSTGAFSGNCATPTAERAWSPASPKTLPMSSEAQLTTSGWRLKPGAEATKPLTFHLHHTCYPVEAPGFCRGGGEGVERAESRRFAGFLRGYGVADLAGFVELAGGEDQGARAGGCHVGAGRLGHSRELVAEFSEAGYEVLRHLAQGLFVLARVVDEGVAVV